MSDTRRWPLVLSLACGLLMLAAIWWLERDGQPAAPRSDSAPAVVVGDVHSVEPGQADDVLAGASSAAAAPLQPPTTRRVSVAVLRWPGLVPAPNVSVRLREQRPDRIFERSTDERGLIELELEVARLGLGAQLQLDGFEFAEDFVALDGPPHNLEIVLRLVPVGGLLGRVVSPLGDPVGGAEVLVWQHWPPRPTLVLDEDESLPPRFEVLDLPARLLARRVSGPDGFYHLPDVDAAGVCDLQLAVVGSDSASEPVRAPLPWPGGELPLLVARPGAPLRVTLSDRTGARLAGARVALDLAPGGRRDDALGWISDSSGELLLPRHLGRLHLSVRHPTHWLDLALDGDRALEVRVEPRPPPRLGDPALRGPQPPPTGWIVVDADSEGLDVVLAEGGAVAGVVRDAGTGRGLAGAVVSVSGRVPDDGWLGPAAEAFAAGLPLAEARADAEGGFDLRVPPRWIADTVSVRAGLPGYGEELQSTVPVADDTSTPLTFDLRPTARASAQVQLAADEDGRVRLEAWLGPPSPLHAAALVPPEMLALPVPAGTALGERVVELPYRDPRQLLFVVRHEDSAGLVSTTSWGPSPILDAVGAPLRLTVPAPVGLRVDVLGEPHERQLQVRRTTWLPWLGELDTTSYGVVSADGLASVRGRVARDGWSLVELVQPRAPVSARLDGGRGWLAGEDGGTLALELVARPTRLVRGRVRRLVGLAAADVCVSLLGAGTAAWRHDLRGQDDWWARPDGNGGFRFEAVPEGDYTLALSSSRPDGSVELLAQRPFQVTATLFNVHLEPADGDDPQRQLLEPR